MDFKIIAVDFDGTLCENKWPEIGEPNKELIAYLKERQAAGDKLILWTCRVSKVRDAAVAWSAEQGLIFDAVNENLPEVLEWMGNDSRKIFANEYIDDRNFTFLSKADHAELLGRICQCIEHCATARAYSKFRENGVLVTMDAVEAGIKKSNKEKQDVAERVAEK